MRSGIDLYVESSFWKRLSDSTSDPRRRISYRFLNLVRSKCRLRVSSLVWNEIEDSPNPDERRFLTRRLENAGARSMPVTRRVLEFAETLRGAGHWGDRQFADMVHVACAMLHSCDALVTWNLRDLARGKLRQVAGIVALQRNLVAPFVGTPLEVAPWIGLKIG